MATIVHITSDGQGTSFPLLYYVILYCRHLDALGGLLFFYNSFVMILVDVVCLLVGGKSSFLVQSCLSIFLDILGHQAIFWLTPSWLMTYVCMCIWGEDDAQ